MVSASDDPFGVSLAKVLVVEDEPGLLMVLTDILKSMGHLPEPAEDGEEAVRKANEQEFDLILLDLGLPRMSGEEVFEQIRRIDKEVPIVIMTGQGSIESAVEFLTNGAADYLTKPTNLEEFKFRINRALEEKRFKYEATTDLKTNLFNYNYFERRLKEELRRSIRYGHDISLVLFDLDDFKYYNDTCGHIAGDRILREIGRILKKLKRDSDIPCRFGGEEFVVILPETDADGAFAMGERIRSQIEDSVLDSETHEAASKLTVSVGVVAYRPRGIKGFEIDIHSLIEKADEALYEAKRTGKNKVCMAHMPHDED